MKSFKYTSIFAVLICLFVFHTMSFAQNESLTPDMLDTVFFGKIDYFIDSISFTGKLKTTVLFVNPCRHLTALCVPLFWTGAATLDSISYVGSRVEGLPASIVDSVDNENHKLAICVAIVENQWIPTGRGLLASLFFNLTDSGWMEIDTASYGSIFLVFMDENAFGWTPEFVKGLFHLIPSVAGDINQDGFVSVSDVVFVINYLFRNGPSPCCSNCADVNYNCEINLIDVVYMINYLFRSGDPPQMGCVFLP